MESKMLTLKLIYFNIIMFYTKYADILAYPTKNIVPDYYFNYSSADRISRAIFNMDWLPIGFCNSGMPVLTIRFCNGRKDCRDGSDETADRCRNNSCSSDMFRCNYGGCIAKISECDGVYQCPDGSDEVYEVCRRSNCIIPYSTNYTVYFVPGCEGCQNGSPIKEGTILSHQCTNKGFSKEHMPNIVCRNGFWTPSLPSCQIEGGNVIIKGTSSNEISLNGSKPEMPEISLNGSKPEMPEISLNGSKPEMPEISLNESKPEMSKIPIFTVNSNSTLAVNVNNPVANKAKDTSSTGTETTTTPTTTQDTGIID